MALPDLEILRDYIEHYASMVLIGVSEDGYVTTVNDYGVRLLGKDPTGRHVKECFVDFESMPDPLELARAGSGAAMLNIEAADGLPQTLKFRFVHDDQASQFLMLGEVDADELNGMRSQIVGMNNELANLTRELSKRKMELERLNELKNRFLGMAAHDLRNPIGIIKAYSSMVLDFFKDKLNPDQCKFLYAINRNSVYMNEMIEDLLDLSKIESGTVELNVKPASLADLISEQLEVSNIIAKNKSIEIVEDLEPDLPRVDMDRNKIRQVLDNIISNAIKYSESGTTVNVGARRGKDSVVVTISDHGQGIPEDELSRIFEPFSRGSQKTTSGEKSTGLGMAIAKRIVEAHSGCIGASSVVGEGTTVTFQLPISQVAKEV